VAVRYRELGLSSCGRDPEPCALGQPANPELIRRIHRQRVRNMPPQTVCREFGPTLNQTMGMPVTRRSSTISANCVTMASPRSRRCSRPSAPRPASRRCASRAPTRSDSLPRFPPANWPRWSKRSPMAHASSFIVRPFVEDIATRMPYVMWRIDAPFVTTNRCVCVTCRNCQTCKIVSTVQ